MTNSTALHNNNPDPDLLSSELACRPAAPGLGNVNANYGFF